LAQPSMWPRRLTSHVYPHQDLIHETPPATTRPALPLLLHRAAIPSLHYAANPLLLALLPSCPSLGAPTPISLSCPAAPLCAPPPPYRSPPQLPLFARDHPKIHQCCHSHSNQKSSELLVGVLRQPAELKLMGMVVAAGAAWFPLALPFSILSPTSLLLIFW
jgi:hypothetical protein